VKVHSVSAIRGIVSAYESCYLPTVYFQRRNLFCVCWQSYTFFHHWICIRLLLL